MRHPQSYSSWNYTTFEQTLSPFLTLNFFHRIFPGLLKWHSTLIFCYRSLKTRSTPTREQTRNLSASGGEATTLRSPTPDPPSQVRILKIIPDKYIALEEGSDTSKSQPPLPLLQQICMNQFWCCIYAREIGWHSILGFLAWWLFASHTPGYRLQHSTTQL